MITQSLPCALGARDRRTAVLSLALLLASCSTTGGHPADASPGAVAGPDTLAAGAYTLEVLGMSCPKCISNVDLQLARIDGVGSIEVDMKHGTVAIDVSEGTEVSKHALAEAVEDAGFTLRSVEPRRTP